VGGGRVAGIGTGVGIQIGDDGRVLHSVDGNRLKTVDTVESEGDGGIDVGRGDCC
jgi:hypothetical protein